MKLLLLGPCLSICHLAFPAEAANAKPRHAIVADCLSCHRERDTALVTVWEKSRHAQAGIACSACHGTEHQGSMAARSRRNETCIGCHPRESGSYTLSKHGVIVTLEGTRLDLTQPLKEGNQRAPTCPYCHFHDGAHDSAAGILPLDTLGDLPSPNAAIRAEARATPCQDCHSPRFVATWFTTGDRMVAIGRMKVREAMQVATNLDDPESKAILQRMIDDHLQNVRLGVGHQSPDDQWWHGHPALDGDLLRIKSLAGDHLLRRNPSGSPSPFRTGPSD
ncbi:MAG: hypothetical protein HQL76_10585 [Magnetococcales bacterium]|nr:hypothetical protein [Magnetococcales bacterium]